MEAHDLDQFLSDNEENFINNSVCELLNQLFRKRNISKATLAKQSGMSEVYLHQVFAGRRNPSRSRLLCLCFGLQTTVEETQELLKQCGFARLYTKNRRDAIILYGILNGQDLFAVNDKLFAENEESLYQKAAEKPLPAPPLFFEIFYSAQTCSSSARAAGRV